MSSMGSTEYSSCCLYLFDPYICAKINTDSYGYKKIEILTFLGGNMEPDTWVMEVFCDSVEVFRTETSEHTMNTLRQMFHWDHTNISIDGGKYFFNGADLVITTYKKKEPTVEVEKTDE